MSTSPSSPFPVPLSHSSLCYVHLSSPFLLFPYLGISFLSFSPSFSPRHPDQLFIQTGCLQLSVRSWVAASEVGRVACSVELFPNTSVSSPHSIHDLSMTLTTQLHALCKTTHTLHGGSLRRGHAAENVLVNINTIYCIVQGTLKKAFCAHKGSKLIIAWGCSLYSTVNIH